MAVQGHIARSSAIVHARHAHMSVYGRLNHALLIQSLLVQMLCKAHRDGGAHHLLPTCAASPAQLQHSAQVLGDQGHHLPNGHVRAPLACAACAVRGLRADMHRCKPGPVTVFEVPSQTIIFNYVGARGLLSSVDGFESDYDCARLLVRPVRDYAYACTRAQARSIDRASSAGLTESVAVAVLHSSH